LKLFHDPIDIFEYIVSAFDKIVVQEGVMRFLYVWGTTRKRERQIAIELVKEEIDPIKLAHLRIDALQRELAQHKEALL
jgi:hypothetical protein